MKMRRKLLSTFAAVSSLAVLSAALLTGCNTPSNTEGTTLQETGTLILSVNPQIQIEYNKEGKVTALAGQMTTAKALCRLIRIILAKTVTMF